jgi:tetratricopeptide (TPR) repeat protein
MEAGQFAKIDNIIEGISNSEAARIYLSVSQELLADGKLEEGRNMLIKALANEPKSATAFNNLMIVEDRLGNDQAIDSLAQVWQQLHADDPKALAELNNLLNVIKSSKQK